jgi:glycosyltransferase involved in cell wall biosynthesis
VDYLSAGRPVLAAVHETGSVAGQLDRSEGAGLVVRPGDPRLMAAAVRALKADDALRSAMGLAGPHYATERLAHREVMRQLEAMLATALGDTVIDLTTA